MGKIGKNVLKISPKTAAQQFEKHEKTPLYTVRYQGKGGGSITIHRPFDTEDTANKWVEKLLSKSVSLADFTDKSVVFKRKNKYYVKLLNVRNIWR